MPVPAEGSSGGLRELSTAIVDTVREALVVLDRNLRVICASRSFYRMFAVDARNTVGRMFYELDDGQWDIPALRRLLEDVIHRHRTIEAYEVEHDFATLGRRLMLLNARQVFDEAHSGSTLLMAIDDITERRDAECEKDALLRQKEVLIQEMQHRVANSLQIIASILLLKADSGIGGNETTTARGVKSWRSNRGRPVSLQAMRQPCEIDDRGPSAALAYCGGRRRDGGIQGGGKHRADHHGVGHQRAEACVPSGPQRPNMGAI